MSVHHIPQPTRQDVFQYRYQHGVNLGGVFVLEQWLHPAMFDPGVSGASEHDAVVSSLAVRGPDATRKRWEEHWNSALTEEDLVWLVRTAGCNHIRLPIGYFTLGPAFCQNTAFAMMPAEIYRNAWEAVKKVCRLCREHGIGVLIDFQAAPGGANADTHSGTSTGTADLWEDRFNLELATRCLSFVAEQTLTLTELDSVVGIQICNQASWNAPDMYEWYDHVVDKISTVNSTLPIYVSDGWDLPRALEWSMSKNSFSQKHSNPILVDTHKYYSDNEDFKYLPPNDIIAHIHSELEDLDQNQPGSVCDHQGAVAVYVGEYSCILPAGIRYAATRSDLENWTVRFGRTQNQRWQEKASGAAFWTFMANPPEDKAWCFKQQVTQETIQCPQHFLLRKGQIKRHLARADRKRSHLMSAAIDRHVESFTQIGGQYEHWRYADGWHLGYTDARAFFASRIENPIFGRGMLDDEDVIGTDTIGSLDLWVLKRMKEEDAISRDKCEFVWEWEHGFRAGIRGFYEVVGISIHSPEAM